MAETARQPIDGHAPVAPVVNGASNGTTNGNTNGTTIDDATTTPAALRNGKAPETQPNGTPKAPQKTKSFGLPLRVLTAKKGPPGGFDDTPLPDAPQGFTVKFTFQYAVNLPPADFNTASSDPFLTATLRAANPRRHKEEPDLVHRTPTMRKTLTPEWHDEWIVANVPATGFNLKCRMYDEDYPDGDDRLGNVTVKIPQLYEGWKDFPPSGHEFVAKKRMISKRAFVMKGVTSVIHQNWHMSPRLCISIEVLGKSDPPYAQMCTIGPTGYFQHFSPMIGRLVGTKVNADEEPNNGESSRPATNHSPEKQTTKYDFQANEMQLQGPVPAKLYHRFVEFRPIITSLFMSRGVRGKILNTFLHKQHNKVYNFDKSTQHGLFAPCSEEASLQFLRLAHFDEGGRIFTYVLTLDGLFRFTETGKEFGIDMLSKHTMHSDAQTYIACSGEFFIRRLQRPTASENPHPHQKTHPSEYVPGGPPEKMPPEDPSYYQLVIDNDSGTYRPDKSVLPELKSFLEENFRGLGVVTMHWEEEELQEMKKKQREVKKSEGRIMNVVMNSSQSSISSAESDLDERDQTWETGHSSKREAAYAAVEDPKKWKDAAGRIVPGMSAYVSKPASSRPSTAKA